MKGIKFVIFAITISCFACNSSHSNNNGTSTPIDSTNTKGSAPAAYGADNPAQDADSNKTKYVNDTGVNATNLHNEGYDSMQNKKRNKK